MTVLDLKQLLEDLPDEMEVLIPINPMEQFDGQFFTPCVMESGPISSPMIESQEEYEDAMEKEAIGIPVDETESLHLVPCGYFSKHSDIDATQN